MKSSILTVCTLILVVVPSHGQSLTWAKVLGGTSTDKAYSNAVDAAGNQYITGHFSSTVDFDPGTATFNLTSVGAEDIFVCKLNTYGDLVWVKQIGSTSSDWGRSIAVDADGNVYLTGSFNGTCDFDPGPSTYNLISAGASDIFVCKVNSSGNFLWAQRFGNTGNDDHGNAITLDAAGNVYTTGSFYSIVDFDAGPGTAQLIADYIDAYITKMNSSGNLIWAKKLGGLFTDQGFAITVDASGNVFTTGSFLGYADMDPSPATFYLNSNVIGASDADMFVSKLDASGSFIWAKQLAGWSTHFSYGYGIAVDGSGNVYTTGSFKGTIDFDPGTAANMIPAQGLTDGFALKLNSSGDFVWVKILGGCQNEDYGTCIKLDDAGNIYTTGVFRYIGDFDPGPGVYEMHAKGGTDVFISKLTSSGNFVWAKFLGGGSDDYCYSIALDPSANIFIAGHFIEWADLDPDAGSFNVTSSGADDIFTERVGSVLAPLPVKFGDVTAYRQNNGIRVEWCNLSESDVANYTIERSTNGQSFQVIGKISASKNNGGRADYSFIDVTPSEAVNFYRIQSIENSGQKLYSAIVKVSLKGGKTEDLFYPNPVLNHQLSMQAIDVPPGQYVLKIVNSAGQSLQQIQFNIRESTLNKTIQLLPGLKRGVYHLQLAGLGLRIEKTLVIE